MNGSRSHNHTPTHTYFKAPHHNSFRISELSPTSLNSSGLMGKTLRILKDIPNKIYLRENDDVMKERLLHPSVFRSSHNKIYGNLEPYSKEV